MTIRGFAQRLRNLLPRSRAYWTFELPAASIRSLRRLPIPGGLRLEYPTGVQLAEYVRRYPDQRFWPPFAAEQARGGVVACLWDGDVLVYRSLAERGPTRVAVIGNYQSDIPEGWFHITHCETHPAYRGRHVYSAMLGQLAGEVIEVHHAAGVSIRTDLENVASQRGILRAGFVPAYAEVVLLLFWRYGKVCLHQAAFRHDHFQVGVGHPD